MDTEENVIKLSTFILLDLKSFVVYAIKYIFQESISIYSKRIILSKRSKQIRNWIKNMMKIIMIEIQ